MRDAGVAALPDSAVRTVARELRPLPVKRFPVGLDGIGGTAIEGKTLHVYGTNLADRSFKRLTTDRTGGVKMIGLKGFVQLDHPFYLQRCSGKLQVTKSVSGPGRKWRLLTLDTRLATRGPAVLLPRFATKSFVVPKLLCDGKTAWLVWSTAKQTRVQVGTAGRWRATHQLKAPARGWPAYIVPLIHAVAWQGKLYLLRSSAKGVEAIAVGARGELRRAVLTHKKPGDVALARVGKRFLAVWLERGKRRRISFRGRPGRVMGRWLDAAFRPTGSTEVFLKRTKTSNVSLHLWASGSGRLVMGRTVRVPRRLMGGGFRYDITSHVSGYDAAHTRQGPWLPLGNSSIFSGQWIGDTLFVIMKGRTRARIQVHVRRFRFGP